MEPREFVLHSGSGATGDGEIFALKSEFGGLSVQITGITSATITFEGTVDGTNWEALAAKNKTTGAVATTATANGIYELNVIGIRKFRARISTYVSGTIIATANSVIIAPVIDSVVTVAGSNLILTASDTISLAGTGVGAHTALDVISTQEGEILEFDVSSKIASGGSGIILDSLVTLNQDAVFSGGNGYYLRLYNVLPTAIADNATFAYGADLSKYIGKILISTLVDDGDNCIAEDLGHNKSFKLASGSQKLYGILQCVGGETTITGKTITINLNIMAS